MAFGKEVKDKALIATARHCCICHRFVGLKIECHHIVHHSEGGNDNFENCIPLCFDCHGDMRSYDSKHPKGTKYSREELIGHRDEWYRRVSNQSITNYDYDSKKIDTSVYYKIRKIIPYKTIIFLKENNFSGFPFKLQILDPVFKFADDGGDVDNEFIDPELDSVRAEMHNVAKEISNIIATNTWPTERRDGWSSVPPEWEYEQPDRFWKITKEIHSLNGKFCGVFDQMVRISRRKLGAEWKEGEDQ